MTKALKITLIVLGALVLIIFIGIKAVLEPMIQKRVRTFLESSQSEFYTYNFKALKLNLFQGTVQIQEVSAIPGTSAFDSLRLGIYDDIDQIYANDIFISINYYSYIQSRKVEISEVRIVDPVIDVFYSPHKSEKKGDPIALNGIFNDSFQGVQLTRLSLENANFSFHNIEKEDPDVQLKSLNIEIQNISIDPKTLTDMPLGFDFESIVLSTGTVDVSINEYYNLKIKSIELDVKKKIGDTLRPGTNLTITGIHYLPNEKALAELKSNKLRNLTEISTDELSLRQFKISDLIEKKHLNIKELIVQGPAIRMYVNSKMKKTSKKNPSEFVLSKVIEDIKIKKFRIVNGQLVFSDIQKSASDLNLRELEVSFDNIHVNESTKDNPLGMSFTSGNLISRKGSSDLGEFYRLETGEIIFDFIESDASINNIQLIPKHSREEFSKVTPYEQDQFEMQLASIKLNNLDMQELNENLALKLQSVEINKLNLSVFRDKWVEDQEFVYKPLPSQSIRNVQFPFWIDSIRIINSSVSYEQLGDVVEYEDQVPGKISLTHLYASALRVTNDASALKDNPELVVNAEAMFMDTRKLTAQYRFVIPDTTDKFYITARIDSFPTRALDPMIKNILLIEMPDGFIHSLEVDMTGRDDKIIGRINMEYENLNVNILKAKKPSKSSGFLNSIANGVIIKNNTRNKGKFITGIVETERLQNKSVFNYTWNGIKSGLISTVVPFVRKEKTKNNRKESKSGDKQ